MKNLKKTPLLLALVLFLTIFSGSMVKAEPLTASGSNAIPIITADDVTRLDNYVVRDLMFIA